MVYKCEFGLKGIENNLLYFREENMNYNSSFNRIRHYQYFINFPLLTFPLDSSE